MFMAVVVGVIVGAPGTVELPPVLPAMGVTVTELEATLMPTELVAVTVQLYSAPLIRPLTVTGLVVPVATFAVPLVVHVTV